MFGPNRDPETVRNEIQAWQIGNNLYKANQQFFAGLCPPPQPKPRIPVYARPRQDSSYRYQQPTQRIASIYTPYTDTDTRLIGKCQSASRGKTSRANFKKLTSIVFSATAFGFVLGAFSPMAYRYLATYAAGFNLDSHVLPWRQACGSPPNSGKDWHSVVGDSKYLDLVKSRYCADAFITSGGKLQVASFTSISSAQKFADDLSNKTRHRFTVSRD